MDKGFEFIDSTRHDRLSRRLARSHAMKGKNAGRKLNRRSKFGPDRLSTGRQTASLHNDVRNCIDRDVGGRRSAVAQSSLGMAYDCFSNQLFSVGLPIEISSHCRYVIKECKCCLQKLWVLLLMHGSLGGCFRSLVPSNAMSVFGQSQVVLDSGIPHRQTM
jgi:hypothetical protein